MRDKVERFISDNNLLCQGDEVTVGLSGGADSVALLCVLKDIAPGWHLTLRACHVNHCLRGEESDADEAFCRELCDRLAVPLTVTRCDVPAYCALHGESVETGARSMRYDALFAAAGKGLIATAHHLDDNAETVLLNLLRGSALDGLCGIPLRRGNIIRPLLCVTREETENYLASISQPYCTDSTNLSDEATRNRLRHAVFPVLRDINPAVAKTIGRTTHTLAADRDFLNDLADRKYEKCQKSGMLMRESCVALPDALRLRVLRRYLRERNIPVDSARLFACDALLLAGSGSRALTRTDIFSVCGEYAIVKPAMACPKIPLREIDMASPPAEIPLGGDRHLEIRILSRQDQKLFVNYPRKQFKNLLDCDRIGDMMVLRSRRDGDAVRLLGRGCTKSLKKLFSERKIPVAGRDGIAVLTSGEEIAWVEGFGVAEHFAATERTERAAFLTVIEEDSQTWSRTSNASS